MDLDGYRGFLTKRVNFWSIKLQTCHQQLHGKHSHTHSISHGRRLSARFSSRVFVRNDLEGIEFQWSNCKFSQAYNESNWVGKITANQAVVNVIMHRINIIIFAQFAAIKFFSWNCQVEKGAVWLRFQLASTGPYDKGWSFALFSRAVYCLGSADSHLSEMLFYSPLHWACAACRPRASDELDGRRWHLPLFG